MTQHPGDKEVQVSVDGLLQDLGRFGRYQARIYILASLTWITTCWHMMSITFQGATPPHQCNITSLEMAYPDVNFTASKDFCNVMVNGSAERNFSDIKCGENGTFFAFSKEFGNTIVSEWNLVCDKKTYSAFAGSAFMIGIMVGATLITPISDRFGRRWSLLLSVWLSIPFCLILAVIDNYYAFVGLRFICGILVSGVLILSWVVCTEVATKELRSYVQVLPAMIWSIAFVSLGVTGYFIRDWRHFQLAITAPLFLFLSYYWFIPETFYWLGSRNKLSELEKAVQVAANMNGRNVSLSDHFEPKQSDTAGQKSGSIIVTFCKSPVLIAHAIIMSFIWFTDSFVYYGISLFSTELSSNRYLSFCLAGLVDAPAYIFGSFYMQWAGRRFSTVSLHAVAGIVLITLANMPKETGSGVDLSPLVLTLSLVGKSSIAAVFMNVFMYASELFPTTSRSAGMGVCSLFARVGGAIAPYVGLIAAVSPTLPPTIFGVLAIVATMLTMLLPETRDAKLLDSVDDVTPSWILSQCCGQSKDRNVEPNDITNS